MTSIADFAFRAFRFLWRVLKVAGLLFFYLPYRCYYFSKVWRYRFTVDQAAEVLGNVNRLCGRVSGRSVFSTDSTLDRFFWWLVVNSLLKYVYKCLKKKKDISEKDADKAVRFFVYMVPNVADNSDSIVAAIDELCHTSYEAFTGRNYEHFDACHGNVFTPDVVFFFETFFQYVTPGSVRALEAAFACGRERFEITFTPVLPPPVKGVVEILLSLGESVLSLAKKAPVALCDGLLRYADNFARQSRDIFELDLADQAICAWQHMNRVRYRLSHYSYSQTAREELHDYFDDMRKVGGLLYNRRHLPPLLPAPVALPPTQQDHALVLRLTEQVEDLSARLRAIEEKESTRSTCKASKKMVRRVVQVSIGKTDVNELPKREFRFAFAKDYSTIVDLEHWDRSDHCTDPYLEIKPDGVAVRCFKTLLKGACSKKNEGWVKVPDRLKENWGGAFQEKANPTLYRFKNEQIQVGDKSNGRVGYWRLIPHELFETLSTAGKYHKCRCKP